MSIKNDTLETTKNHYSCIIVGGGIVGAGAFRDLSLHGIDSLLIDKKDFTSQTSSKSSKMLHGGIRYLENLDFALVWEALHEKNLWLKKTPHLCYENTFYLPIYNDSKRPLWMLKIGLLLYDILSGFQNTPHKIVGKEKLKEIFPGIKTEGLKGAGVYHDAVVKDAKMTLDMIFDAKTYSKGHALNYTSLSNISYSKGVYQTTILDEKSGKNKEITADHVIFATGPYTDQLLSQFDWLGWHPKLLLSKGSHLWLKPEALPLEKPMVLTTKDDRIIFVIPQETGLLVGTTEDDADSDIFDMEISEKEKQYLIQSLNNYFPNSNISESDILSSFAGVRPLVKDQSSPDPHQTSRVHKVYQPHHGLYVIMGGKYTTFRVMAADAVRPVVLSCGKAYNRDLTEKPLNYKSFDLDCIDKEKVLKIVESESVKSFEDLLVRRLNIPNRNHWKFEQDFDSFWEECSRDLSSHITINREEIASF